MFSPLSRLRRQLSQRESQVPRVMHYTERCIEVRPRYLFDKFRFAGEFGSIVSYGRINYKNSHSSLHCCGCSLPYEHRPLAGDLFLVAPGEPRVFVAPPYTERIQRQRRWCATRPMPTASIALWPLQSFRKLSREHTGACCRPSCAAPQCSPPQKAASSFDQPRSSSQ